MRLLETKRLYLKPVTEADLPILLEMQWDKDIMTFMNFKPLSMTDQKTWLNALGTDKMAFSVFLKGEAADQLIGLTTLNQINPLHQRASWGMKLTPKIQGKGIGMEATLILLHYAFAHLNLRKIHGDILFENTANRRMCEKVGVREEGVLIKHYYQNGHFRDVVLVGILKEEFYQKNTTALLTLNLINET